MCNSRPSQRNQPQPGQYQRQPVNTQPMPVAPAQQMPHAAAPTPPPQPCPVAAAPMPPPAPVPPIGAPMAGAPPMQAGVVVAAPGAPGCDPNVPFGLELLAMLDYLFVNQAVDWIEVMMPGVEQMNRYAILDRNFQRIMYAYENTPAASTAMEGKNRRFNIHIINAYNQVIMTVSRQWAGMMHTNSILYITASTGEILGFVRQDDNLFVTRQLIIMAQTGMSIFTIRADSIYGGQMRECNYAIFDAMMMPIGLIKKHYSGYVQETQTDADNFSLAMPLNLDVRLKATLLGAVFHIDFLWHEDDDKKRKGYNATGMTPDFKMF